MLASSGTPHDRGCLEMHTVKSAYAGGCTLCGTAWSCAACLRTSGCVSCKSTARCGACRNIHSKAKRAAGAQAALVSSAAAVKMGKAKRRRVSTSVRCHAPSTCVDAIDLPRSREGLNTYYTLLAQTTTDLWSAGGGRWMHNPKSTALHIERVNVKDNYETPPYIWRHAIDAYKLNRDAHASSLNAVLPNYDTKDETGPLPGARYWLNPAFGAHCGGIRSALESYVWQRGCAVVALLPALLHTDWWHDYVMHADEIFYLRDKVRFSNPFLDEVQADYFYSFVLVHWEAARADASPALRALELRRTHSVEEAEKGEQKLRVRRCAACGKYRVLPRHQPEMGTTSVFKCEQLADVRFASCEAPCPVWLNVYIEYGHAGTRLARENCDDANE